MVIVVVVVGRGGGGEERRGRNRRGKERGRLDSQGGKRKEKGKEGW